MKNLLLENPPEFHQLTNKSIKLDVVDCTHKASNDGCDEFMWRTVCKFSISSLAISLTITRPKHLRFECFLHEKSSQTALIILPSSCFARLDSFRHAREYARLLSPFMFATVPPRQASSCAHHRQIISSLRSRSIKVCFIICSRKPSAHKLEVFISLSQFSRLPTLPTISKRHQQPR